MKYKVSWLLAAFALSACGILGITTDNDTVVTDPEFREQLISKFENTPEAKSNDSLIAKIDLASTAIPSDVAQITLVIETYDFAAYSRTFYNKFRVIDSAMLKRWFAKYDKKKLKTLKNPLCKTVYADRKTYETYDPVVFRYVLKRTTRHDYERDQLVVTNAGRVYPYVIREIFYLYDRQTGAVFREIKGLKILEK